MIPFVAALVAFACAAAGARRIWYAAHATALHPDEACKALAAAAPAEALARFRAIVAREPEADWERDLLAALGPGSAELRVALVNEQLTELDYRVQRWSRVPRVCASVASSAGFMLATLILREGLVDVGELPSDLGELFVRGLVGDALTVAALGLVGTAFCVAAQSEARRLVKARTQAADRLVERLEALVGVPTPDAVNR